MIEAVETGALSLEKLEAMTAVCSVGLDMFAVPGDTSAATLSAIIADELAIGMANDKTTGVRVIPAPGTKAGDMVDFGGLLGRAPGDGGEPLLGRGLRGPGRPPARPPALPAQLDHPYS